MPLAKLKYLVEVSPLIIQGSWIFHSIFIQSTRFFLKPNSFKVLMSNTWSIELSRFSISIFKISKNSKIENISAQPYVEIFFHVCSLFWGD